MHIPSFFLGLGVEALSQGLPPPAAWAALEWLGKGSCLSSTGPWVQEDQLKLLSQVRQQGFWCGEMGVDRA